MRDIRQYVPALLLAVGCFLVLDTRDQSTVPLAGSLKTVLADMPEYRIQEQHVSDAERRVAGMTDYVARIYWRDSLPAFTTYVGYYDRQTQGKTIHSPRNCLPGAGWEILSGSPKTIAAAGGGGASYTVNRYILKNGPTYAVVYYWYQGRGRVVANEYRVKWNLLRDAALRGHTEEALVRIVVPVHLTRGYATDTATLQRGYDEASALGEAIAGRLVRDVARVLPSAPGGQATVSARVTPTPFRKG